MIFQVSEWFGNMRRRIRIVTRGLSLCWEQKVQRYNSLITGKSEPLPILPEDLINSWNPNPTWRLYSTGSPASTSQPNQSIYHILGLCFIHSESDVTYSRNVHIIIIKTTEYLYIYIYIYILIERTCLHVITAGESPLLYRCRSEKFR